MFSLKGSPGVTTLACMLAASWPSPGIATVVEADPAGGDLAARFGLSAKQGWPSLSAATRRSDGIAAMAPHLQKLPGGVPVLVGARGIDRRAADSQEARILPVRHTAEGDRDVAIVDLGRFSAGDELSGSWLRAADHSVVVTGGEASAALHLRQRASELLDLCGGRLDLIVVGSGPYGCRAMSEFTGIEPLGDLPWDSAAAAVARGASGSSRRLERSLLWIGACRLAATMAGRLDEAEAPGQEAPGQEAPGQKSLLAASDCTMTEVHR